MDDKAKKFVIHTESGLYWFLIEEKGYTEAEAEETLFYWEFGHEIPPQVKADCEEYYRG